MKLILHMQSMSYLKLRRSFPFSITDGKNLIVPPRGSNDPCFAVNSDDIFVAYEANGQAGYWTVSRNYVCKQMTNTRVLTFSLIIIPTHRKVAAVYLASMDWLEFSAQIPRARPKGPISTLATTQIYTNTMTGF